MLAIFQLQPFPFVWNERWLRTLKLFILIILFQFACSSQLGVCKNIWPKTAKVPGCFVAHMVRGVLPVMWHSPCGSRSHCKCLCCLRSTNDNNGHHSLNVPQTLENTCDHLRFLQSWKSFLTLKSPRIITHNHSSFLCYSLLVEQTSQTGYNRQARQTGRTG